MKNWKYAKYFDATLNAAFVLIAYYLFRWLGVVSWLVYMLTLYAVESQRTQNETKELLRTRLAERCALCKREILDEGGVFDLDGIYHEQCAEKFDQLEDLRRECGVPKSKAVHRPRSWYDVKEEREINK